MAQKKVPGWLMRNSRGEPDAMWTLTFVAFVVTTFAYFVSAFSQIQVGDVLISFQAFDGLGYAAVVLVPLLGAYFGRRYTTAVNETAISKAQIYAQVAKRNIGTSTTQQTSSVTTSTSIDNIDNVAKATEEELEELEEPKDEA